MRVEEAIAIFEEEREDRVQEIILLGKKKSSIRRLILEEKENDKNYFG
jgi:hypothetical protein